MSDEYENGTPEVPEEEQAETKPEKKSLMLAARIICVMLAVFIWLYVVNITSDNYEKTFTLIPIRLEGEESLASSGSMSVYDQSETVVSVTVSGKRSDVSLLDSSDFKAWIDVSGITESGRHNLPVKLSLPDNVSAISHTPSEVSILADARTDKTVPVKVRLSSYSITENLIVSEMISSVENVKITGPAATLRKIEAVEAEVDLSSAFITSSFLHNAKLIPVDADGKEVSSEYISIDVHSADVSVKVLMSAKIPLSVSFLSSVDPNEYTVEITPSSLTVLGDVFAVSELSVISVATVGPDSPSEIVVNPSSVTLPAGISFADGTGDITVSLTYHPASTDTGAEETSSSPEETSVPPEETSSEISGAASEAETTSAEPVETGAETTAPESPETTVYADVTSGESPETSEAQPEETSGAPEDITAPAETAAAP